MSKIDFPPTNNNPAYRKATPNELKAEQKLQKEKWGIEPLNLDDKEEEVVKNQEDKKFRSKETEEYEYFSNKSHKKIYGTVEENAFNASEKTLNEMGIELNRGEDFMKTVREKSLDSTKNNSVEGLKDDREGSNVYSETDNPETEKIIKEELDEHFKNGPENFEDNDFKESGEQEYKKKLEEYIERSEKPLEEKTEEDKKRDKEFFDSLSEEEIEKLVSDYHWNKVEEVEKQGGNKVDIEKTLENLKKINPNKIYEVVDEMVVEGEKPKEEIKEKDIVDADFEELRDGGEDLTGKALEERKKLDEFLEKTGQDPSEIITVKAGEIYNLPKSEQDRILGEFRGKFKEKLKGLEGSDLEKASKQLEDFLDGQFPNQDPDSIKELEELKGILKETVDYIKIKNEQDKKEESLKPEEIKPEKIKNEIEKVGSNVPPKEEVKLIKLEDPEFEKAREDFEKQELIKKYLGIQEKTIKDDSYELTEEDNELLEEFYEKIPQEEQDEINKSLEEKIKPQKPEEYEHTAGPDGVYEVPKNEKENFELSPEEVERILNSGGFESYVDIKAKTDGDILGQFDRLNEDEKEFYKSLDDEEIWEFEEVYSTQFEDNAEIVNLQRLAKKVESYKKQSEKWNKRLEKQREKVLNELEGEKAEEFKKAWEERGDLFKKISVGEELTKEEEKSVVTLMNEYNLDPNNLEKALEYNRSIDEINEERSEKIKNSILDVKDRVVNKTKEATSGLRKTINGIREKNSENNAKLKGNFKNKLIWGATTVAFGAWKLAKGTFKAGKSLINGTWNMFFGKDMKALPASIRKVFDSATKWIKEKSGLSKLGNKKNKK